MSIGKACAIYQTASGSTSAERRFITLLDADQDQLPHRLRQMIALLKEQAIDFDDLLKRLFYWNDDQKRTQNAWARDFYRNMNYGLETEPTTKEEENK
jgi:CRISPR system Cascade subunit CasB